MLGLGVKVWCEEVDLSINQEKLAVASVFCVPMNIPSNSQLI